MSQLNLPSLQQFEQMLQTLMSTNNDQRTKAEQMFNQTKTVPDYCISSLIQIIQGSKDDNVRELACILLRKVVAKGDESIYEKLSLNLQGSLKKELLKLLASEKVRGIRHKLENVVSTLGATLIEKDEYSELLQTCYSWVNKDSPAELKETSLNIFNQLGSLLLEKGLSKHIGNLKQVFAFCLKDTDGRVLLAAVQATCSIVLILEDKKEKSSFAELIPGILSALGGLLNLKDYEAAKIVLECLIEINSSCSSFYRKYASNLIEAMFQIAKTKDLQEDLRHLSMEFVISLAENSPKTIQGINNFIPNLFPLAMQFMLEIEDDEDWEKEYEEDDLDLTSYDVGLESLDRVALCLGGESIAPVAFKYIPQFLNNKDSWKHRHAGIMAISQTAEGCAEQYEKELGNIVKMALKLLTDEHPRVRYAAIHSLAQLSTDFSPMIQKNFHNIIIPGLLHAMADKVPKVQSHAATSIVNFVEKCPSDLIQPYLDQLLSTLINLLKSKTRFVQEQTLSAISALAGCAEKLFIKYYDYFVPIMKEILLKATGKGERLLRARSMECVSLIGVAVGAEKFSNDAKSIMEILIKTQMSELDPDDPQIQYIQQAFARIAQCLGQQFVPFLDYVIPPLFTSAELQPEVIVVDADESEGSDEEGMESVTVNIKGVGEKRISIRTSTLEEKSTACSLLYTYIYELSDGMLKYVEKITKIMVPLLKFAYLEEIRETAANIMPELFKAVKTAAEKKVADPKMVGQIFDYIVESILDALKSENDVSTQACLVESLAETVILAGKDCLTSTHFEKLTKILSKNFCDALTNEKDIRKELEDEEDEEEIERMKGELQDNLEMITASSEFIGSLFKTHPQSYPNYFINTFWPIVCGMLAPNLSADVHRNCLCIVCDFIEEGNGSSHQFFQKTIIPAILAYSQDKHGDVRQAAVFAIGSCSQFGSTNFKPYVQECLKALINAIQRNDAKTTKNMGATCNAVSALFKIAKYCSNIEGVNSQQIISFWFNQLPVGGDSLEAIIVHRNLIDLIQTGNSTILGEGNKNVPQIIKIFAQILNTDEVDDSLQEKIIAILKEFQTKIPSQVLQNTLNSLTSEEKENLGKSMK